MRTVTTAEAERNLTGLLDSAALEPVRIRHNGSDLVVVSALQFEQTQEQLRQKRIRAVLESLDRCSAEAQANGFTDEMLPDFLAH